MKRRTADVARGKWRGILMSLGIDQKFLTGKHGPCPMCEGTDRYRWDNKDGDGCFICNQCGAGNGFDLLMQVKGWDFATTAAEVDKVVGNVDREAPPKRVDDQARRKMLTDLWLGAAPLMQGDMAYNYLKGRVSVPASLPDLRFHDACPIPGGTRGPAMIAMVRGPDLKPVTIHRTFVGPQGKADLENPRALMPGEVPAGSAVHLFRDFDKVLGIAEGIETALAAADKFGVPVWSALNSAILSKWQPPEKVEEVIVFGDCDQKYGGQAAAYALAHKLAGAKGLKVRVEIPGAFGTDWADAA